MPGEFSRLVQSVTLSLSLPSPHRRKFSVLLSLKMLLPKAIIIFGIFFFIFKGGNVF